MTPKEIEELNKQLELRAELEQICKARGFSLWDVFYSNQTIFVDPDNSEQTHDPSTDINVYWFNKFKQKGGNPDTIRVRKYPARPL